MFYKLLCEPADLSLLKSLNSRMNLPLKEKQNFLNLKKGYEGEQLFASMLENQSGNWIVLHDLLLECSNNQFQIDFLLLSQKTVYLFEVKTFEGDYYIENDNWYIASTEIKDPLLQLKRSKSLLRRLLQELGSTLVVEAYLVFVNPEFTLYQAPRNQSIIFPTQLNRFLQKLKLIPCTLNQKHTALAEKLVERRLHKSQYERVLTYEYDHLEKGIVCTSCEAFMSLEGNEIICGSCGCKEDVDSAIIRNVSEFNLLFPDMRITTNHIQDWCQVIPSKKTIRRVLMRDFVRLGHGKSSHFVYAIKK
ncbi:nuclease-related domain-containing protein [Fredinandcohnia quinoae]|uniref:NERD domain-containing protein n=1 Tax=Fredinandcohnia quinoae TaxID=2918902 RepID=A0AAW5DX67_9BACI|nr:nuclease-related domain-containing protein [Fredinandcohnia sp. SECRCQ15]MCH1625245.1 NERD domain-containing protein [Fredinandcohnia sp. SECRCQ15]